MSAISEIQIYAYQPFILTKTKQKIIGKYINGKILKKEFFRLFFFLGVSFLTFFSFLSEVLIILYFILSKFNVS